VLRFLVSLVALGACTTRPPPSARLRLIDDAGVVVGLPGPARRIVSLIPASTELLFALGAGDRLVGRTTWCDYPPEAARIPSVGDGLNPNVEAVVARQPDLVVLYQSPSNHGAAERFRGLGLATIEVALNRIADFERAARILGRATGHEPAADSLIRRVRAGLDSATMRAARPPNVLLLAWEQPP